MLCRVFRDGETVRGVDREETDRGGSWGNAEEEDVDGKEVGITEEETNKEVL